jgi:ribonucleoside-diphosphate reductase alpha chain
LIQQTGGGQRLFISRLRYEGFAGEFLRGSGYRTVGFLRVYDHAFGEVAQGGQGAAQHGGLARDHPDIEEFISCKTYEKQITNLTSPSASSAFCAL